MRRTFALVSFEGPDWYAWRGDLAERVASLATELVTLGWHTHHIFLGDPRAPGTETLAGGLLTLHRWAQWLSAEFPAGVYHGEEAKQVELTRSLPAFLTDQVLGPALSLGRVPTVVAEEWQTAGFLIRLADRLVADRLSDSVRLVWRAGSRFGWERIDWERLAAVATIATTTPGLHDTLRGQGVESMVLPVDPPATLAALFGRERRSAPAAVYRRPRSHGPALSDGPGQYGTPGSR
jgi:hypothetical protein